MVTVMVTVMVMVMVMVPFGHGPFRFPRDPCDKFLADVVDQRTGMRCPAHLFVHLSAVVRANRPGDRLGDRPPKFDTLHHALTLEALTHGALYLTPRAV